MPIDDLDWQYISGFMEGEMMLSTLLASLLIEAGLLKKERVIGAASTLVQALDAEDPRSAVVQRFVRAVAKGAALKSYPKHPTRGPRRTR